MEVINSNNAFEPRKRGPLFWGLTIAILIVFDVLSRVWCFAHCDMTLFPYFGLHPFANAHFAFSIPVSPTAMYSIYVLVLLLVFGHIMTSWQNMVFGLRLGWVMIMVGATVNVVERVMLGYVRDFIQIGTGYMNIGDMYILCGVAYILYKTIRLPHPKLS